MWVFCHHWSDSLKHHMPLSLFGLENTVAAIHVGEDVVLLGATVGHLQEACCAVQQLTVLPSQVLTVGCDGPLDMVMRMATGDSVITWDLRL